MCGEHWPCLPYSFSAAGSSPHVRGAPQPRAARQDRQGIIPACAGSTRWQVCLKARCWDHPRMCGEHVELEVILFCSSGSSPHVRGALWWPRIPVLAVGIIPACAGSTRRSPPPRSARRDHPRMCGEHKRVISFADSPAGSSPHVRGARRVGMDASVFRGIIPACAGSTALES